MYLTSYNILVVLVIYCTSKRRMLIVWDIAGMKNLTALHIRLLVVPWTGIYVLEAFESSRINCPGGKNLCMGSQ